MRFWLGLIAGLLCWLAGSAVAAQGTSAAALAQVERLTLRTGQVVAQQTVVLPDTLPKSWLNDQVTLVYRWRFEHDAQDERPQALWIFRAGAPYRLTVNGEPARRLLPLPEMPQGLATVFNGRSPTLFALPQGEAQMELTFQTRPFMQHGLVDVHQGSTEALALLHAREYARVADPVFVTIVLSGTLFLLALMLWAARPELVMLGLFAGLCGTMALRHWLIYRSGIGLPPLLYEHLNPYLILCFDLLALAASWKLADRFSRQHALALLTVWGVFTLVSLTAIALPWGTLLLRDAVQLAGLSALLYIVWFTLRQRHRLKPSWTWSIALGYLFLLLGALHDLGLSLQFTPVTRGTMIIWGFAAVVLAYAYVTADYVLQELQRSLRMGNELEQRVNEARGQLQHSYEALAQHEKREAARQERSQIMRELHDSLGAQLVTALRGVERDALSKSDLLEALQDSLSSLRQLLSTQGADGRLVGALANWRQHWQERLAQAGVDIHWEIDDSADDVQLPPETLHQLLRILQECATNTLKHAQANRFRVWAGVQSDTLLLSFCDNGQGFESTHQPHGGQGLMGMETRVGQIGARWSRSNGPAPWGACVRVELPLNTSQGS